MKPCAASASLKREHVLDCTLMIALFAGTRRSIQRLFSRKSCPRRGKGRSVSSEASTSASERAASSISKGSLGAAAEMSCTSEIAISTVDCDAESTLASRSSPRTSITDSVVKPLSSLSIIFDWRGVSLCLKKTACTVYRAFVRSTRKAELPCTRRLASRPRTSTSLPTCGPSGVPSVLTRE